jgi:hypothetical protein
MPDGRRTMTWTALRFDGQITPDVGRAAVLALAGISGSPRLVLEVTGRGGLVSWKLRDCDLGGDIHVEPDPSGPGAYLFRID